MHSCSLARNQSGSVPARTHDYVPCSVLLTARIAYYKGRPFSWVWRLRVTLAHPESQQIVMHTVCGNAADSSVGSSTTL